MLDSIKDFKPTDTYFVKVDMQSIHTYTTESGMEFYHPKAEGDMYQNKPMLGELVLAPEGCKIPIGSTVYMNYLASDTQAKIGQEDYYIIKDNLIVAYDVDGERKAYQSILISVFEEEKEKIILDLSEDEFMDAIHNGSDKQAKPTSSAEVLDCDNEWLERVYGFTLNKGDIIEYEKNLDWSFIVNWKNYHYIQWADKIIHCNNKLINRYNEIIPIPKHIVRAGLLLPNLERFTMAVDGEFKGKKILPEMRRIELNKYIKSDFIYGHLD